MVHVCNAYIAPYDPNKYSELKFWLPTVLSTAHLLPCSTSRLFMGKHPKKARQAHRNHHDFSGVKKNFSSHGISRKASPGKPKKATKGGKQLKPIVPFRASDRILLVGEGEWVWLYLHLYRESIFIHCTVVGTRAKPRAHTSLFGGLQTIHLMLYSN
jgi:hypothetical protein